MENKDEKDKDEKFRISAGGKEREGMSTMAIEMGKVFKKLIKDKK